MLQVELRTQIGEFQINAAFQAPSQGITAMLGPSGAGKSTLLAIIAGTLRPDFGQVSLDGRVLLDTERKVYVTPEKRRLGIVHQDALLFPHMPVEDNLRYGLKRSKRELKISFDDIVSVLDIRHLLDRRPQHLSGGERQRVALGRAMLSQPDMLLLDEPVSALDAPLRADILQFAKELNQRFNLPMLMVTHMVEEARMLADHIVLLNQGRVSAEGSVDDLLSPAYTAIGVVVRHQGGQTLARFAGKEYWLPLISAPVGAEVKIKIEPSPQS